MRKIPKWIGSNSTTHYVAQDSDDKSKSKPWLIVIELPKRIKTEKGADKLMGDFMDWLLDHHNKDYND